MSGRHWLCSLFAAALTALIGTECVAAEKIGVLGVAPDAYVEEVIKAGHKTTVSLDFSEEGLVTRCQITGSSGDPAEDAKGCELAARFRMQPRLVDGHPTAFTVTKSIVWDRSGTKK